MKSMEELFHRQYRLENKVESLEGDMMSLNELPLIHHTLQYQGY